MSRRMLVVAAAVLLGACVPEVEEDRGRTSRGRAGGVIGARADSLRPGSDTPAEPAADTLAASAVSGWTTDAVEVAAEGRGVALQQEVRVATHDAFDRIVLDFGSDAIPGYRVEYVDRPVRACGSGEVVELPGEGWLSIRLTAAAAHDEQGHATVASRDLPVEMPVILRVRSTCDFEGEVTWVAAVRSPNPYRVLELRMPNRLVVDVRR